MTRCTGILHLVPLADIAACGRIFVVGRGDSNCGGVWVGTVATHAQPINMVEKPPMRDRNTKISGEEDRKGDPVRVPQCP